MERKLLILGGLLTGLMLVLAAIGPNRNSNVAGFPSKPPADPWFQQQVIANPRTVLVDFSAEWCPPCKMLAPFLDRLEQQYSSQLDVVKVDVDERGAIAGYYGINALPTLLLFKEGKLVSAMLDVPHPDHALSELRKFVQPHLASTNSSSSNDAAATTANHR